MIEMQDVFLNVAPPLAAGLEGYAAAKAGEDPMTVARRAGGEFVRRAVTLGGGILWAEEKLRVGVLIPGTDKRVKVPSPMGLVEQTGEMVDWLAGLSVGIYPLQQAEASKVVSELESDGWLVNQTRMWLASHWSVRNQKGWLHGQERMHQELIDGSRAANLLGWQWTVGAGTGKPYGFARWQVEKRAPGLCGKCPLRTNCPIQEFPDEIQPRQLERDPLLDSDPDPRRTAGPLSALRMRNPQYVLLTIDSLGDSDPAMVANPDLPVVFIFNESALAKLQLSSRRIGFYLETLKDLSERRELQVYIGDPYLFAQDHEVAVTFAPVPSFKKFKKLAEVHPYPWLRLPHAGSVRSFSSWRQKLEQGVNQNH
jgi:deoxyribodipyrimidine photo-lyase